MKLYYNSRLENHIEIADRMKSMTLAFESEENENNLAELTDGQLTFVGDSAIAKYLDEIAGELHSWYYCNC